MKKIAAILMILMLSMNAAYADQYYDDEYNYDELISTEITVNVAQGVVLVDEEQAAFITAPYLSENGTTMIEMNTLIDAVGAELTEDGDTITVDYAEVSFLFTMNQDKMSINGQMLTMPSPIVWSAEGVAMVPLRFFAECLGGDVIYDTDSEDIGITIYAGSDEDVNFKMLLKYAAMDKIGNSKQKWRISKPETFEVEENWWSSGYDFYLEDAYIEFSVTRNVDKFNIDQLYVLSQEDNRYSYYYYYNNYGVLFEKTKGTRAGLPYICFKWRHTDSISETHIFLNDNLIYSFNVQRDMTSFAVDKTNAEVDAILDSFEVGYKGGDEENTVDLATVNVKPKEREKDEYTDGNLNWTITLNDKWWVNEYYGFYNHVSMNRESDLNEEDLDEDYDSYYDDDSYSYDSSETVYVINAEIEVSTYSIPAGQTLSQWIEREQNDLKSQYNKDVLNVDGIKDTTVGERAAKMFTATHKYSDESTVNMEFYYLQDGRYLYEIAFSYDARDLGSDGFLENAHAIIHSFSPGVIDEEEIGDLLEIDSIIETNKVTKEFENDDLSLTLPCQWYVRSNINGQVYIVNNDYYYYSGYTGFSAYMGSYYPYNQFNMIISKSPLTYFEKDLTKSTKTLEEYIKENLAMLLNQINSVNLVVSEAPTVEETEFAGKPAYKVRFEPTDNNDVYVDLIFVDFGDYATVITATCSKDMYDSYTWEIGKKVINSIKFKK